MSTDHETNKAAVRRFHDATNTGDLELIARTIDELDAQIRWANGERPPGRCCERASAGQRAATADRKAA